MKIIPSLALSLLAALGLSFGRQALAQDNSFEREFSKFDKDFERLNSWKAETPASKKLKHVPPASTPSADHEQSSGTTTPLSDDAHAPAAKSTESAAPPDLPKGAKVEKLARNDRLGNQISDPAMRKKVQDLYKRSDVVVQQYVLPTN